MRTFFDGDRDARLRPPGVHDGMALSGGHIAKGYRAFLNL